MKKIFFAILFVLGIAAAYVWGILNAQWQNEAQQAVQDMRQREFALRVEMYEPTCGQLQKEGLSPVVTQGDDRIMVHITADYFYVIGINLAPGKPPLTTWWGAGRENALKDCRKK